jgi:carbonic anhydrase
MTGSLTAGNPPPRRAKFASLICLGTPPVQEGKFWRVISCLIEADAKNVKSMSGLIIETVNLF